MHIALKYSLLALSLSLTLAGCGGSRDNIKGEGAAKDETRVVTEFTGVDVSGQYQIIANVGTPASLTVTSNENLLPYIITNVNNKTLHVENKDSIELRPTVQQRITIKNPNYDSFNLAGAGSLQLMNVHTEKLEINLAGSQQLLLTGQVDEIKINADGASTVDAKALVANHVDIVINGMSQVLTNPTQTLKVVINGSGKIINFGKNPKIEQVIHGAGTIENATPGFTLPAKTN